MDSFHRDAHQQTTNVVLMVRPCAFAYNEQTAASNAFQSSAPTSEHVVEQAVREFDLAVEQLRAAGVCVLRADDTPTPPKPDAVFPNNWFSTHDDGTVVLYPMLASNRRLERSTELLRDVLSEFQLAQIIDLSSWELEEKYLEGTGSLVLDRRHRVAFAALSPRTSGDAVHEFAARLGYEPVLFRAADADRPIYHTNVVMCVGERFAAVCLDAIAIEDRKRVSDALERTRHRVIALSVTQLRRFAGNMLELKTPSGSRVALSTTAANSLTSAQRDAIESLAGPLLPLSIPTIEHFGGGSVRCMLAEIFLPRRKGT